MEIRGLDQTAESSSSSESKLPVEIRQTRFSSTQFGWSDRIAILTMQKSASLKHKRRRQKVAKVRHQRRGVDLLLIVRRAT